MTHRSVLARLATFVAVIAGLVMVLSSVLWRPPQAQAARRVPDALRAAGERAGRIRVIVELALP